MKLITAKAIFQYGIGLIGLLICQLCFAVTVIGPNTVITSDTTYSSDTLDMSAGSFIVKNGAKLTIEECAVQGTISPSNPLLIRVVDGKLVLNKNIIQITASGIPSQPTQQSLYQVMFIDQGTVTMTRNTASVDQPYSVGLLLTNDDFSTDGFDIEENFIRNFHGVLYLINSNHAKIATNIFRNNSFANVFNIGNESDITGNLFLLPGNLNNGNNIDILNSDKINIVDNIIESASCLGISVANSTNITIDSNKIVDGLTYAIGIGTETAFKGKFKNNSLSYWMAKHKIKSTGSSNIVVTNNYMAENRYGLAADMVTSLTVKENIFIQRFDDDATRKFWTDNTNLLLNVSDLTWEDNSYKEAFTQINGGDNTKALQIVPFPASGGVTL